MMPMITMRPAVGSDSRDLFEWRNDIGTRQASVVQDLVSVDDHERWFAESLESSTRWIYLAIDEESGLSVGMCRFDLDAELASAEVSINLAPTWRGKGLALEVLIEGVSRFRQDYGLPAPLTATIRGTNRASERIFMKAGFALVGTAGPFNHYRFE